MFSQNDQIHNNLHLTVENSIEIGKVYQVTEKWVFFKLLLQPYKQTHLGVRITQLKEADLKPSSVSGVNIVKLDFSF